MAMDRNDVKALRNKVSAYDLRYNRRTEKLIMRPNGKMFGQYIECGEHVSEDIGGLIEEAWASIETLCEDLLNAMPLEEE